ncbi:WD repeat protein [Blastomyces dermatitidis ER-3]|uniref:WD repeat protein n=2 Tax=Ajellomyces dermatitidis TaxID=5039 RepID=F2TU80_AJEDA|nr:WD repeat protein [Blastomyces dermatitidis ER-3]EEQ87141.1 WD repeat protein [Blastomyces dermatitidis ER-3]EGE86793.1 WD repeat protein [Blastomyces dermatitidis ATCC 18188]
MSSPMALKPLASAYESPTFGEDSSFHVEQPVGSMSISPCGRDVVLASKEGLHIIDLDSPYSPPRYLPHHTPWEVADVQWSPFAARDSWVVSTSNQKALVWNLAMKSTQNSIEYVLHAHSRAITDINFSAHHPDVLATCAVDSFIHCWDLRCPARPAISFSDWFAGATQVKWNRQDPHVIASSHDRFLQIWDDRVGARPLRTIVAHNTKIYGLDWNRTRREALVTCSLDKTIKFWDYSVAEDIPEKVIHTPFPVWRARNTPFGWGVLVMPQRGNSDLHLYSRKRGDDGGDPPRVHSFPGHRGQVKEFLWRSRGTVVDGLDHREFQLVSWGTDKELRLHRVNPEILEGVGYEIGKSFNPSLNLTRKGAVYKTFRDDPPLEDNAEQKGIPLGNQTSSHHRSLSTVGVGPSSVSMPYYRSWNRGGTMGSVVGVQGRSALRADMNPISWMRGVKISGWEVETLGDEITHVGEKFTKVSFESVNVGQRKTTVSMHGPWGPDNSNLFIKVDIKFPPDYPRASIPVYTVQKTSSVTAQLASTMTAGLRTIAETYLAQKRGSLEGAIRYLLGEHNVEESVALVKRQFGEALKSPDLLDGDESSDDDEENGQFRASQLGLSSSEMLRPVNANVMVPVYKTCGAFWTNDGRLVCFFPPKKEKATVFMGSMGLSDMRLARSDRVFEAFGRLQTSSPGPKPSSGVGTGRATITDDGVSDYSDDSSVESSSSSGSSDLLGNLPPQFHGPNTWRSGSLGFYRSRSTENSQKSTTGVGTVKSSSDNSHNIIHIYDLKGLLPAKRELAEKYQVFGNPPDICAHNMAVAAGVGIFDLAHVWGLVRLMLQNELSSNTIPGDDVVGIARKAMRDIKGKDSAVDSRLDEFTRIKPSSSSRPDKVKWGEHALGRGWLIPALFNYFERLGDIQMLAMLSCILYEPKSGMDASQSGFRRVRRSSVIVHHPPLAEDNSSPTGNFHNKCQATSQLPPLSKSSSHGVSASQSSACSSTEHWQVDTPPLYSTGNTPPQGIQLSRQPSGRKSQPQVITLSGSPDRHSNPRSVSGLGTTLASSLSRSFTFGPSGSSSPPSNSSKKRPSPAGSLHVNGPSGWTTGGIFGKPASAIPDHLTASTTATSQTPSDSESERPTSPKSKPPKGVKIVMKNQHLFDCDNHNYSPLLDQQHRQLFKSYRAAYANLLFVWDMPITRKEVLKIDGASSGCPDMCHSSRLKYHDKRISNFARRDSRPLASIRSQERHPFEINQGLDIQRNCARCGCALHISAFEMSSIVKDSCRSKTRRGDSPAIQCPQCKPPQPIPTKLSCVICAEVIDGMFAPCLNCGHITCIECHQNWFATHPHLAAGKKSTDTPFCPSGCGCICSDHVVIKVPMPSPPNVSPPEKKSSTVKESSSHRSRSQPARRDRRRSTGVTTSNHGSRHDGDAYLDGRTSLPFVSQVARGLNLDLHQRKHASRKSATRISDRSGDLKNALERVDTL